jgi:hypothetical protein
VVRVLLFVIVVGALAVMALSLLRRTPRIPADRSAEQTGKHRALPGPKAAHALGREAVRHKLHELAFGAPLGSAVPAEHAKVVSAVAGVLHAAATDPKYAPRRPMLLPQLLRAVNAEKVPEVVWEQTYRAAAAAELHASAVENADPFAAQLLALVMGLATIVVDRVALDQYASRRLTPDATALASLLDEHVADVAHRIASSWELSEQVLEALDDQRSEKLVRPSSALGRSLRFGLTAGALSMLRTADLIDDDTGIVSMAAAGGEGQRFERLWERLTWPEPGRVPS